MSTKNEFTEKYQKFVEQNSEKILTIEEPLSLFKTFSGTITKALKDYIPKHNKKEQKTWITEDIKELFDKRRKAKGTNEYPLIDKQVKKKCNEEYTKFLEVKCKEIGERLLVNPAEAHKRIEEISGKQRSSRRTSMIKNKNGLLL